MVQRYAIQREDGRFATRDGEPEAEDWSYDLDAAHLWSGDPVELAQLLEPEERLRVVEVTRRLIEEA